jgi:hypothetical protein
VIKVAENLLNPILINNTNPNGANVTIIPKVDIPVSFLSRLINEGLDANKKAVIPVTDNAINIHMKTPEINVLEAIPLSSE